MAKNITTDEAAIELLPQSQSYRSSIDARDNEREDADDMIVDSTVYDDLNRAEGGTSSTDRHNAAKIALQYRKPYRRDSRVLRYIIILAIPVVLLFSLYSLVSVTSRSQDKMQSPAAPTGISYAGGFDMKQNWGSISPYFDTGVPFVESALPPYQLPGGCTYKQVHILHRHAERYPTGGAGSEIEKTVQKLYDIPSIDADSPLAWITDWTYTLGTDLLTPIGVASEFKSGAEFWSTHGHILYNATNEMFWSSKLNRYENGTIREAPLLRTTEQSRIQASAKAWAAGFFGTLSGQSEYENSTLQYRLQFHNEENGATQNNTLAPYVSCPNSQKKIKDHSKIWIAKYLQPAAIRLNKLLPPTTNLSTTDVYQLQQLCVYETAYYGSSRFCELFTETEWRGYEYSVDLDFYYSSSYGMYTSAALGSGWVAELVARLQHRLITQGEYGVNTDVTNNTESFPLDQPFYMDMTHDSCMMYVLTALGFDFLDGDLPDTHIPAPRPFIISRLTPFGARLYIEILDCSEEGELVRIKLNNRVLPLDGFSQCTGTICSLPEFIASLKERLAKIDYDYVCYGEVPASAQPTGTGPTKSP